MSITLLILLLATIGACDTLVVHPDLIVQPVNPYNFGANINAPEWAGDSTERGDWYQMTRTGMGIWHIPSDSYYVPPPETLGYPDPDYMKAAKNARIPMFRYPLGTGRITAGDDSADDTYCNWKVLVGPWRNSPGWVHTGDDSVYLPERIQEFGIPQCFEFLDSVDAYMMLTYTRFQDKTLYTGGQFDSLAKNIRVSHCFWTL